MPNVVQIDHLITQDENTHNFLVYTPMPIDQVSATPTTVVQPATAEIVFERTDSRLLLETYVHEFPNVLLPYEGPDEPLKFEPEDYPIR